MDPVLVFMFLAAILGVRGQDPEPTTVCYPPSFQATYYNMLTEDTGFVYVDFAQMKHVQVSNITGDAFIHDYASMKSYAVSDQGNECKSSVLRLSQVLYHCLPPYAKIVHNATGSVYHDSYARTVSTWQMQIEMGTMNRVVFAQNSNNVYDPLFSMTFGYHGITEIMLYTYLTQSVTDPTLLAIPGVCASGQPTIIG